MNSPNNADYSNLRSFRQFARAADALIEPSKVKVVLDVGSRDAEIAVYLKEHYPNAVVYAFECNPAALEICRQRLANQKDIFLVDRAVSDAEGVLDFFPIDAEKTASGNIGASSLYQARTDFPYDNYVQNHVTVESITLEAWARRQGISGIDVIWMDLQGAELRALKGMGNLIQTLQLIFTEVEYKSVYVGQPLYTDVEEFLGRNGFCLCGQFNGCEYFGDELYCRRVLFPWWKQWLRKMHMFLRRLRKARTYPLR